MAMKDNTAEKVRKRIQANKSVFLSTLRMMQDTKMAAEAACSYANLYRLHTDLPSMQQRRALNFPLREHKLLLVKKGKKCSSGERTNLQQGERQKKGLKIKKCAPTPAALCNFASNFRMFIFLLRDTRKRFFSWHFHRGYFGEGEEEAKTTLSKAPAHDSLVPKNEAQKMCVYT
jgi:hypothetical protein